MVSYPIGMPHADVLNALPDNDSSKFNLAEECRARAKGAFKAKDMPSAERLFTKAYDLQKEVGKVDAAVPCNLAMARLHLGKFHECIAAAEEALTVPGISASLAGKAAFRAATAHLRLDDFTRARGFVESGRKLDEAAGASFGKLAAEIDDRAARDAELKKKFKTESQKVDENMAKPTATRVFRTAEEEAERAAAKAAKAASQAKGATASTGSEFRGYKKTADGKTTSYFHTELDDAAKELMPSFAPKKIEAPAEPAAGAAGTGSAWNAAGTFESTTKTMWFKSEIRDRLEGETFHLEHMACKLSLKVVDIEGDAEVIRARAKTKYVQDVSFKVKWEGEITGKPVKGQLVFENDGDSGFEVESTVDNSTSSELRGMVGLAVSAEHGTSLRMKIQEHWEEILTDFRKF